MPTHAGDQALPPQGGGASAENEAAATASNDRGQVDYAPAASSRRLEIFIAVLALAASVGLVWLAGEIEIRREPRGIGPRAWPRLLGYGGVALSVALLLCAVFRKPFERDDLESLTRLGLWRSVIAGALAVAFVLAWPWVGFAVAAVPFLIAVTYLFGGRGWRTLVVFPVLITAFILVLFQIILKVPL